MSAYLEIQTEILRPSCFQWKLQGLFSNTLEIAGNIDIGLQLSATFLSQEKLWLFSSRQEMCQSFG